MAQTELTKHLRELYNLTSFLLNNLNIKFALTWSSNKNTVIVLMTEKLKIITELLKGSGLKVNETKTELCLFYRKETPSRDHCWQRLNQINTKYERTGCHF